MLNHKKMKNFYLLIFCVLLNSLWCQMDGGKNCDDCSLNDCGNSGCEYAIIRSESIILCHLRRDYCHGQGMLKIEEYDCISINNRFNTKKTLYVHFLVIGKDFVF